MKRYSARLSNIEASVVREILKTTARPEVISFAGGLPNPSSFPIEKIREATNELLSEDGPNCLQYSTTEGYLPLRQWIAKRYASKGALLKPENILITTGAQQGTDLLGKVFIDKGDEIVMEEPGYIGAIQALSLYEPEFLAVPLEDDGIDIALLKEGLALNPKLFYAVPNFQNPSGISYSYEKRKQVAELIKDSKTIVVEDDPYGELNFEYEPNVSMGSFGLDTSIVFLGSFSKIFSPSMRLGWICAAPDIIENLRIVKQAADLHTNYFSQRILFEYLSANNIDDHICSIRKLYKAQCASMLYAIKKYFPANVEYTKPKGGMFIWVTLPNSLSAKKLFEKVIAKNVAFVPGEPFYAAKKNESTFRLNYTNSGEDAIIEGIKRIGEEINKML